MSGSLLPLGEKFDRLLKATTAYFAEPQGNLDHDRVSIERVRELALLIAAESSKPHTFGRFIAFLLGAQGIQAQYPLHAIQFMCLTALALREDEMKERDLEEVLTAAFLGDFGFRAAWLSFQNAHSGAAVFHLRGLGLSWWSLWIERMVLYHHDPVADASPHRIFSIISQYLALTQRTGVDDAEQDVLAPARAVEAIMNNSELDGEGKRYFLNAVAVYPLGSWVRLNNGQKGLVIGHPVGNPLRPTLGIFHRAEAFGLRHAEASTEIVELALASNPFIVSEAQPSSEMAEIFAHPELWIGSWLQATGEDDAGTAPFMADNAAAPPDSPLWNPALRSVPDSPATSAVPMAAPVVTSFVQSPQAPPSQPIGMTAATRPQTVLRAAAAPVETVPPAPLPLPEKAPPAPARSTLTPEELVGAASELAADVARTLEHLEVELHHLRHRGQTIFSDVPEALKKIRRSFDDIRAFALSLASESDADGQMLTGALHIWEGDIAETEAQLHALRAFSTLFLDAWEAKKQDAQRLLQSLHGPELAARWDELQDAWRSRIKPALEEMAHSLGSQWQEKQLRLQNSQSSLHQKLETAERTRLLLVEKMALVQLSKGLRLRKAKAWKDAIAAFEKALMLNPSLWEAHTYLGLCHMDAASDSHFKNFRSPPAV